MIYFIKSELSDGIKIGYTNRSIEERIKELALPNVEVLAVIPGDRKDEANLHRKFRRWRIGRSEWFQPAPEIMAYIDTKGTNDTANEIAEMWDMARAFYGEVIGCNALK